MKIKRTVELKTKTFEVGDVFSVKLKDGQNIDFMAMQQQDKNMLFMAVQCLNQRYTMKDIKEKDILNTEILDLFPKKLKKKLIPFENGSLLRLPREKEVFGENKIGADEGDIIQFEPMKYRYNRIGFSNEENYVWWWLDTPNSATPPSFFAVVGSGGSLGSHNASCAIGVRPLLQIENR